MVIGDTVTVKIFGSTNPTEVTVPVPAADAQDGTPVLFSERTLVPLLFPGKLVHPDDPR